MAKHCLLQFQELCLLASSIKPVKLRKIAMIQVRSMPVNIDDVRKVALRLAGTTEEPHHNFGSFRVRGKIFVTIPPGEELLHIFLPDETRELALAADPQFLEPVYWGTKILGVRVHLRKAKKSTVLQLVKQAYEHKSAQVNKRKRATDTLQRARGKK